MALPKNLWVKKAFELKWYNWFTTTNNTEVIQMHV
jgi:hypothetical protein